MPYLALMIGRAEVGALIGSLSEVDVARLLGELPGTDARDGGDAVANALMGLIALLRSSASDEGSNTSCGSCS